MTKRYSIAEARANLPTIVNEVEAGADIELTRRGKPVAVVVSRTQYERLKAEGPGFAAAYRLFRERYSLEEIGTESDVFEGLRDSSPGRDVKL